jgi:hypothetical protein
MAQVLCLQWLVHSGREALAVNHIGRAGWFWRSAGARAAYAMRSEAQGRPKVLIERWRREYNTVRPHSALGYRPLGSSLYPRARLARSDDAGIFTLQLDQIWVHAQAGSSLLSARTCIRGTSRTTGAAELTRLLRIRWKRGSAAVSSLLLSMGDGAGCVPAARNAVVDGVRRQGTQVAYQTH